jgi:hypothetical protein
MSTSDSKALELTKLEIRDRAKRDSSRKLFNETYDALVQTLQDTYPDCKDIPERGEEGDYAGNWHLCMSEHYKRVKEQDKTLMLANVPVLLTLKIPQLWIDGQFTKNSERYIWMYIANLSKFSEATEGGKTPKCFPKDINPPKHISPETMPGMQQIYNELPKEMFEKVKMMAEKYSKNIEDGETAVEDLKFDEISKEIFSQIDPDEMQDMVTSVGSFLQNAMSNGDGEIGDIFKMFGQGLQQ